MYIIEINIKGFKYWLQQTKDGKFRFNGLKDNAEKFKELNIASRITIDIKLPTEIRFV